jgi:hypothetical protein
MRTGNTMRSRLPPLLVIVLFTTTSFILVYFVQLLAFPRVIIHSSTEQTQTVENSLEVSLAPSVISTEEVLRTTLSPQQRPCRYGIYTIPTPTIPGVYAIPPDKTAGIGSIINLSLENPFMKDFRVVNTWSAYINEVTVIVYAGSRISRPEEGGVFVQWGHPGDGSPVRPYGYFPTPELKGEVRVVDAQEVTLVLESVDKTRFRFNLCNESYLKS